MRVLPEDHGGAGQKERGGGEEVAPAPEGLLWFGRFCFGRAHGLVQSESLNLLILNGCGRLRKPRKRKLRAEQVLPVTATSCQSPTGVPAPRG